MTKDKLNNDIKYLNEILIQLSDLQPSLSIQAINLISKVCPIIGTKLDNKRYTQEIKDRGLVNEYISTFSRFDVDEALNIGITESERKLKNKSFNVDEKEIIIETFEGCAKIFVNNLDAC